MKDDEQARHTLRRPARVLLCFSLLGCGSSLSSAPDRLPGETAPGVFARAELSESVPEPSSADDASVPDHETANAATTISAGEEPEPQANSGNPASPDPEPSSEPTAGGDGASEAVAAPQPSAEHAVETPAGGADAAQAEESRPTRGTVRGRLISSRPMGGAIVYLEGGGATSHRTATMDQRGQQFSPHVLPVVRGTTVRFLNNDPTEHNVYSPDGTPYDLGNWNQGEARTHTFTTEGVYTQLCRLHPSMVGYVVVVPNSHFTRATASGEFTLRNLPAGRQSLRVWHERGAGGPVSVVVPAGGEVEIEIPAGRGQ